jgi:hypothetical protein
LIRIATLKNWSQEIQRKADDEVTIVEYPDVETDSEYSFAA